MKTIRPLIALTVTALSVILMISGSLGAQQAQALLSEKDGAQALSKFQSTSARFARGQKLFASGNLAKAAQEFESCLKSLPEHVYASYYLANVRYVLRDYAGALSAIEDAERHLEFMKALDAYARAKKIDDIDEAKRLLIETNEATSSCRESRELEQMVLNVDMEKENTRKEGLRRELVQRRQASQYAYFHGNILFQLGRFDEAFDCYNRAVRIDPQNGDAYNNAASILYLARRLPEAEAAIHKAVAAGVEDRINLKLKKLVMEAQGKPSAGIMEEAFEPAPGTGGVRVMRFSINANEGRAGEAPLFVNTYVVSDGGSRDAVIIDPGAADPRLEAYIRENGLTPRLILNTHGHFDHRRGNTHYARLYGLRTAVPREDASFYEPDGGSPEGTAGPTFVEPEIKAGSLTIKTYATPGHSPGGACFLVGGYLFSGDSLFEDTVGRIAADTPSAEQKSRARMIKRLVEVLAPLPGDTVLLPGHGKASTAARVREVNPFLTTVRAE